MESVGIIVGAGPAGLTAAYELATRTDITPVVLEADDVVGGISRTVNHAGNRIDIGGHRFFSKSDRVMDWWLKMLPLQKLDDPEIAITYQRQSRHLGVHGDGPDPDTTDEVMLLRPRKSRIFHSGHFYDYPLSLSLETLTNLGAARTAKILASYLKSTTFPIRNEQNLEQFLINRFGRELYRTFFKSYTEKVWGMPCDEISAEWGAQRIKGLSIGRAVRNALSRMTPLSRNGKAVETSLIEQFLYPKFGPGQMWETCEKRVLEHGGQIRKGQRVKRIIRNGERVEAVVAQDVSSGEETKIEGDYVFSTMPVQHLVRGMDDVPDAIREISEGLIYRDFITVGLLLTELRAGKQSEGQRLPNDNWIYIQDPTVQLGRLQIFNNWGPGMIADPDKVWVGLEYFCDQGDQLWTLPDDEMIQLGIDEMERIGFIDRNHVLDSTVIRMPKAYPAYFGTYDRFSELRSWIDRFENLFLLGRNGMHRYNNQDHSMLTAMTAVDGLVANRVQKSAIWDVNTEDTYHESRSR